MLEINQRNLKERQEKILLNVMGGKEFKIENWLFVQIGLVLNEYDKEASIAFFQAAQHIISSSLALMENPPEQISAKIEKGPKYQITINFPNIDTKIKICQLLNKEKLLFVIPNKKRAVLSIKTLSNVHDSQLRLRQTFNKKTRR